MAKEGGVKFGIDQAKEPGAKVGAWNANNGPNQLWHFEPSGGGAPPHGQQQYQYSQHQQHYQQHGGAEMHRYLAQFTSLT